MPFINDGKVDEGLEDIYENAHKLLKLKNPAADKKADISLPYLDGDCYIQLYARETSAELRLIGTDGAKLKRYPLKEIEETMAAFNTVHRSHTCFRFSDDSDVPDGFMNLIKTELSPQTLSCASYDALCEGAILHKALVLSGGPRDSTSLRQRMNSFSSLFSSGRHPQTCTIKKFGAPRNVQQKDRFNKKSFPFRKPFKAAPAKPAVKVQPAFTPAFVGGQLAPLDYPLEYPDYATEVVEGGKYTYSFVLIPLAILGTAIVSMMPR
jgi:hypothetical protein